jgi:hypothetical protein
MRFVRSYDCDQKSSNPITQPMKHVLPLRARLRLSNPFGKHRWEAVESWQTI